MRLLWNSVLVLGLALPAASATIVCFGDSNTEGFGRSSTDAYLGALGDYLSLTEPTTLINRGVGGESTFDGLSRIDSAIANTGASYVIIMLGTNDIVEWSQGNLSPSTTQFALTGLVAAVQRTGKAAILATVQPPPPNPAPWDNKAAPLNTRKWSHRDSHNRSGPLPRWSCCKPSYAPPS